MKHIRELGLYPYERSTKRSTKHDVRRTHHCGENMYDGYGNFFLKMALKYHPKMFFTDNRMWRSYMKSFFVLAWHGLKKTRLCVYQLSDSEYYHLDD